MTHDDVQALAADYVLGLVDEVTRARVASHLKACGSCSADLRALAETCDALGRSVPDVAPPASLRDRIASIPAQVPQAVVPLPSAPAVSRRSSGLAAVLPWVAAVAAAVVAVTAIWQAGAARAEVQRLRQALSDAQLLAGQAQLARVSMQQRLDEAERHAAILRASDAVTYTLVGNTTAKDAHARAFVTHKNGMIFTADGLPALPAGKTYQLWVIAEGKPVSVGVFAPDASGRVHAMMDTPAIATMPSAVAVTLEPAGGLAQPSTAPILVGTPLPQ
jgi:anti-sigma-K factor RskA